MDGGMIVKGGLWPGQRAWWNLPNFYRMLVGGYGSGKTQCLCKRMISLALENTPHPVMLVSPSYQMARKTTIATLNELLEGKRRLYGDQQFRWHYHKTEHEYRIVHHGRLGRCWIGSGDNPDSLRGPNIAAAGLDEAFKQPKEVFDQITARIRIKSARRKEFNAVGTPEILGWAYDLAEGELGENLDVGVVHISTRENLALDDMYVERLYGTLDERTAQAYVEGKFIHLGAGLVYYAFDPTEHVVEMSRPQGSRMICGMDFNVDPMAAAVGWVNGTHVHIQDEIEMHNSDTEEMCGLLKDRYWHEGLRDIYPDPTGKARRTNAPAGQTDMHIIERFGFNVWAPHEPWPRRDRFNSVNGKLKARDGRITLTISPKCRRLKKYLSTYSHENMNTEDGKRASHLTDAFSFPVAYLFPVDTDWTRAVKIMGF